MSNRLTLVLENGRKSYLHWQFRPEGRCQTGCRPPALPRLFVRFHACVILLKFDLEVGEIFPGALAHPRSIGQTFVRIILIPWLASIRQSVIFSEQIVISFGHGWRTPCPCRAVR